MAEVCTVYAVYVRCMPFMYGVCRLCTVLCISVCVVCECVCSLEGDTGVDFPSHLSTGSMIPLLCCSVLCFLGGVGVFRQCSDLIGWSLHPCLRLRCAAAQSLHSCNLAGMLRLDHLWHLTFC